VSDTQKWIVRDRTGSLPDKEFDTEAKAMAWFILMFEYDTKARPTVIYPTTNTPQGGEVEDE